MGHKRTSAPDTTDPPLLATAPEAAGRWHRRSRRGPVEVRNAAERAVFDDLLAAAESSHETGGPIDSALLCRAIDSTALGLRWAAVQLLHGILKTDPDASTTLSWFVAHCKANGRAAIIRDLECDHPTISRDSIDTVFNRALGDRSAHVRECAVQALGIQRHPGCLTQMKRLRDETPVSDARTFIEMMIAIIEQGHFVQLSDDPSDPFCSIWYPYTTPWGETRLGSFGARRKHVDRFGAVCLIRIEKRREERAFVPQGN